MNVIELSAYRLYKRMQAVDRNMTLFLDQYMEERAWDAEMNRIYREACACEDRSAALLDEFREPPGAA